MSDLFTVLIGAALVNNVALHQFLGLCPLLGGSRQLPAAHGLGMATTLVITLGAGVTHLLIHGLLRPLGLQVLTTLTLIVVVASLVQLLEVLLRAYQPVLHQKLGLYLPLITSNCAVLGVMLLNVQVERSFGDALLYGLGAGLGFWLALVVLACQRERLEAADPPAAWRGAPLALVSAGLTAMALLGLAGVGSA